MSRARVAAVGVAVVVVALAVASAAAVMVVGVRAADDAAAAAAAATPPVDVPKPNAPEPVPYADPRTLQRIDPRDTTCATPDQRVSFAFALETEVLDEAVANATGHAIALKLVTTNVTLNGCRYTATDPLKPNAEPWELITAADLFTADECAKLIAFAESKHLFAGRRVPLPATATDAEKAAAASTPVPEAASAYVNESLAHEFGLELEPLEDRLAAWLNVTVEELEYFQLIKLVDGTPYSAAPFQLSPSRDIDYTNSRLPLTGDDVLIADAIQHHRIASVFVFLSAPPTTGSSDDSGGWSQFPGTLNVRVQPRVGSALYWPTPTAPAVEYNGTDPAEAERAVSAVTPRPIVHVAEPTSGSAGGGVRYGLNVWVYPNVWRGDVDDDMMAGDDVDGDAAAVFDDEDDDDVMDDAELREFDAEDDEDLDRSPEVDVVGGGGTKAADGDDDDDDDADADPPGGVEDGEVVDGDVVDDDDAEGVDPEEDAGADEEEDGAGGDDGDDNPFLQYMSGAELKAFAAKLNADADAAKDAAAAAAAAAATATATAGATDAGGATSAATPPPQQPPAHTEL